MTHRFAIMIAPYYREICDALLAGAQRALSAAGAEAECIEVPGALEIPPAIAILHTRLRYQGYVALGCVLRGETTHYDTVAEESARGLMQLALTQRLAIGNGILTCETEAQAWLRADPAQGDKGGEAARAALALASLKASA